MFRRALFLALAIFVIGATPVASKPADFCNGRPTHPHCQSPSPTATATPAATASPTATPAPTPTATATPTPILPTPTPSPTPTQPPSGPWTLVFEDQFSVDIPLGSFQAPPDRSQGPGGWGSYDCTRCDTSDNGSYDTAAVVSVINGDLIKHLHYENGEYKVAALMPILASGTWNQLYGRYELRWVIPNPIPGYKIAWLLWPQSESCPANGEIDFPESNLNAGSTVLGFMHRVNASGCSDQDAYSTSTLTVGAWHTTVIEWKPNDVRFILDGVTIGHSTSRVPNTPMRWVIQTETQIGGGAPSTSVSGDVRIDYVKVWAYTP